MARCWKGSAAGAASLDDSLLSVWELSEALPSGMGDGSAPAAPLPCAHMTNAQHKAPAKEDMQGRLCCASSQAKCSIIIAGSDPCCCGDWLHLSGMLRQCMLIRGVHPQDGGTIDRDVGEGGGHGSGDEVCQPGMLQELC